MTAKRMSEADSRIIIDDQLRAAEWKPADKSQVLTEVYVSESGEMVADGQPKTGLRTSEAASRGFADYVLLDQRGRPLAVIEAKKQATNPYVAKQQALPYAKKI